MLIDVRGMRMHVEPSGEGDPVLFLHGALEYIGYSGELVELLDETYRVIQPEQQGHGRTADRPGPLHYADMADDTIALIDSIHLDRPHVVGFSDGGIVGLIMAMRRPDLIGHLVAIGANVSVAGFTAEARRWLAEVTPETWAGDRASKHHDWPVIAQKVIDMLRREPDIPLTELAGITSKVLIVGGDHDEISLEHLVAMYRAIPNAQLCIVPNASHELTVEQPELLAQVIRRFLGSN